MKIITTNINNGSAIIQRIVANLLKDTTVRSGKATMSTGSSTSLKLQSSMQDMWSSPDSQMFMGREFSLSFKSMFEHLSCGGGNTVNGKTIYEFLTEQTALYYKAESILTEYSAAALQDKTTSTGAEISYDRVSLDEVALQVKNLYTATNILSIVAAAAGLKVDLEDPKNAYSFRKTVDHLTGNAATNFISAYSSSFQIVGHTSHGGTMNTIDDVPLGHFDVVVMNESSNADAYSIREVSNFWADVDASSRFTRLHHILSSLERVLQVPSSKKLYDDLLHPGPVNKLSDSKAMNILLTEADRIRSICAMKVFLNCQAWVGLFQIALKNLATPLIIDKIKSYMPNLAVTYDIDKLINDFMALPIGGNTALILNGFPTVSAVNHSGERKDVLLSSTPADSAAIMLQKAVGSLAEYIPYLHSVNNQKKWWDIYRHGASLCSSAGLTFQDRSFNADRINLSFCQLGVTAGDPLNHIDDWSFGCVFDWALNRFNSSALTHIRFHDIDTDSLVTPYHYGLINYQAHVAERETDRVSQVVGGKITGFAFSALQYPMIPLQRVKANIDNITIALDQELLGYGPVSLLPVAPERSDYVLSSGEPERVKKPVVGKYETSMDKLPLEFFHQGPIPGSSKAITSYKKSTLFELLNVSQKSLDRILSNKKATTVPPGMMSRFIRLDTLDGELICSGVTKDQLFANLMNYTYFVPLNFMSTKMEEIVEIPILNPKDTADGLNLDDYARRVIGPFRILNASPASSLVTVPGRMNGSQVVLGTGNYFLNNPDDIILNFTV